MHCYGHDRIRQGCLHMAVVRELRGIKKHCEGLLAEKLADALTGERIPPPKRKRNHNRKRIA